MPAHLTGKQRKYMEGIGSIVIYFEPLEIWQENLFQTNSLN